MFFKSGCVKSGSMALPLEKKREVLFFYAAPFKSQGELGVPGMNKYVNVNIYIHIYIYIDMYIYILI